MKKLLLSLTAAAALLTLPAFTPAPTPAAPPAAARKAAPEPYAVQQNLSGVGWRAKKVGGAHNGAVPVKEGTVQVQGKQIVGGSFTFAMDGLTVEDTDSPRLLSHLKSDDFFSTAKHPTATFVITSVKPTKADDRGNNADVTGNLTIKGITKSITFPAKTGVKDGLASASGTATIDRTQFDIKYRSKSLLETAADKVIDDNFIISFNINAKKEVRS
ncbi:YceI family protein [Hymenobacter gummosus]|uniref:YceI family protein n=1 Tax=Hymenobacter gummosus TaxID=1776032 RepID=A0A431TXP2_9BACT|nr:YceI family protein [Hymenobacter gummosus]RTQ46729.1 YceI family protein [Hymenobacter gummosus]